MPASVDVEKLLQLTLKSCWTPVSARAVYQWHKQEGTREIGVVSDGGGGGGGDRPDWNMTDGLNHS